MVYGDIDIPLKHTGLTKLKNGIIHDNDIKVKHGIETSKNFLTKMAKGINHNEDDVISLQNQIAALQAELIH